MDEDKKLLELMKLRIIRSYRWRKDVIVPLADELGIAIDDFEQILMNHLDMSSLEAIHATFESALPNCLNERLHVDLKFCWLCDVLEIITTEEADKIKLSLVKEIIDGKDYDKSLEDGKKQVLGLLQNEKK